MSEGTRGASRRGRIDPQLAARFEGFAREARRFSREIGSGQVPVLAGDPSVEAKRNLKVVRTIFSKWNLEILALLYPLREVGFEDLRRLLVSISSPVLARKLRFLHDHGLIERTVVSTPVIRVHYALTDRGLLVAQLGEPVLLYLRMTDGLFARAERFEQRPAPAVARGSRSA